MSIPLTIPATWVIVSMVLLPVGRPPAGLAETGGRNGPKQAADFTEIRNRPRVVPFSIITWPPFGLSRTRSPRFFLGASSQAWWLYVSMVGAAGLEPATSRM